VREFVQQKLEEIQDIEITPIMSDDIIEEGKTYFSFYLTENNLDTDLDKNSTKQVNIVGFLKRKELSSENTLSIIDRSRERLNTKFKEMNTIITYQDMPTIDGIIKVKINGYVKYNELTYRLD
jgi:hypothetical protein